MFMNKKGAGWTTGMLMGITTGLIMASNMNRRSRSTFRKSGKMMRNLAEDMYFSLFH